MHRGGFFMIILVMFLEAFIVGLVVKHFVKRSKVCKSIVCFFKGILGIFTAIYLCASWSFNSITKFNAKMKQKVANQNQPSVSKVKVPKTNVIPFPLSSSKVK
jgi:flagellar biosynthesis protein FliQ